MVKHWVIAVSLALAAHASAAPPKTVVIERSIARVDDEVIWESELKARQAAVPEPERAGVLDAMIDESLVVSAGRKAGITADRAEVMEAFAEIKKQNNLDDAGIDAALTQAGYTRARYLVELERQLIRLRAANQLVAPRVDVKDADIEAEAKQRKLPIPLSETDKSTVQRDLRRRAIDELTVKWIADLRKRALIERRP